MAVLLVGALLLTGCSSVPGAEGTKLVTASYPTMVKYPIAGGDFTAYSASLKKQRADYSEYTGELDKFFSGSIREFLSGAGEDNAVYSPVNVYMALAMLAECTDGTSREQILDLLDADSMEALRSQARAIWNASYVDDGVSTNVLAGSIWLRDGSSYNRDTLKILADNYFASSFSGEMGSDGYNKLLQSWLNDQTGNVLKDQTGSVGMDPGTILALATTVYLKEKWSEVFSTEKNDEKFFHGADGDNTVTFMNTRTSNYYYYGEKFGSILYSFTNNGYMTSILPDEGVSVDELLADEECMEFILGCEYSWEGKSDVIINLSLPKFDAGSSLDLVKGLKNLGVTDVFSSDADFSPLLNDTEDARLTEVTHAGRVVIDEEGVTAAAFTLALCGASAPASEEIDFVLDRPFIFVIKDRNFLPVFVGVVNSVR